MSKLIKAGAARTLRKSDEDDPAIAAVVPPPARTVRPVRQPAAEQPKELPMPVETNAEGPLSEEEAQLLAQCESELAGAQVAFVKWGKSLQNIRDRRLYRVTHLDAWEEYLKDKWEMGPSQAHRLIQAWPYGEALHQLVGDKVRESHVRELIPLGDVPTALALYRALVEHSKGRVRVAAPAVQGVVQAYRELIRPTGGAEAGVLDGKVVESTAVQAVEVFLERLGQPAPEPAPAAPAPWEDLRGKVLKPVTSSAFRKAAQQDPAKAREVVQTLKAELDRLLEDLPK